jgi:hypothetical protein
MNRTKSRRSKDSATRSLNTSRAGIDLTALVFSVVLDMGRFSSLRPRGSVNFPGAASLVESNRLLELRLGVLNPDWLDRDDSTGGVEQPMQGLRPPRQEIEVALEGFREGVE